MKSKITLNKFYNLLNRTTEVTLISATQKTIYFQGFVKDIPDEFDDYLVGDFTADINDNYTFIVKKGSVKHNKV